MENEAPRFYEFNEFRLDIKRRLLEKNGEQISISTKHFDLLFVLVRHEGEVLTHEKLLETVWDGTFVEQSNLKKGISALRQILGETPNSSIYIRTIPKRGYLFVAPVKKIEELEEEHFFFRQEQIVIEEQIVEEEPQSTIETKSLTKSNSTSFFSKSKVKIVFITTFFIFLGSFFFLYRYFSPKTTINFSIENNRIQRLTNEGTNGNITTISPDGNYIAFAFFDLSGGSLRVKQLVTGSITQLIPPEPVNFWGITFSPDGNYVYYVLNHFKEPNKSGLYRIPSLGGKPQKLQDLANIGLAFTPDGSRLFYVRRREDSQFGEIVSIKPDGSDLKKIFTLPTNRAITSLNISPDGKSLLCSFRETADNKSLNYVSEFPIQENSELLSEKIIFPKQPNIISNAVWLPVKSSMILNMREPNADIVQIWQYFPSTGERKRVTNDNFVYRFSSLTRDGKSLVSSQEQVQAGIWVGDTEKFELKPITSQTIPVLNVLWTNDNRLTFMITDNFEERINLINEAGSDHQVITDGKDGIGLFQNNSNDGKSITYSSSRDGTDQIWKIGLDGKGLTQLTQNQKLGMVESKLLSDGKTLISLGWVDPNGWLIFKQDANGVLTRLTESDTSAFGISNDEKLIFNRTRDEKTKKYHYYVRNFVTNELIKVFDFNSSCVRWSPDNKALIYVNTDKGISELIYQPINSDKPRTLYSLPNEKIFSFDFSPDGKKIALIRGHFVSDSILVKAEN
ncbi:MAG: winged helix-turn-helix domain-containing protein [Pyrinomonadaceae bacterium]|nr:winged helix-turn-helix domain-containing protein [Pyrinomonadaceae bacterium]